MKLENLRKALSLLDDTSKILGAGNRHRNRHEMKALEHIWIAETLLEESLKNREAVGVKHATTTGMG